MKQDEVDPPPPPPRVKELIFFLVRHMDLAIKVRESVGRRCEVCGETLEIRNLNKHTGFDELKLEGCPMV